MDYERTGFDRAMNVVFIVLLVVLVGEFLVQAGELVVTWCS